MQVSDSIGSILRQYAEHRFQQFSTTALSDLSAPSDAFCIMPSPFLTFLSQNTAPICGWLDQHFNHPRCNQPEDTVSFFSGNMIRFIHNKNQFVNIGEREAQDLARLYETFLVDFRDALKVSADPLHLQKKLKYVFASHQRDLEYFVRDLASANNDIVFHEPVCQEYSPALQLAILHAEADQLAEPILDLGCGSQGQLVHDLHRRGKTVFGVDRAAAPSLLLSQSDWLDYPLKPNHWGTVISHMALSNHFLHHHLNPRGLPENYARLYMAVLHSLKPNGRFFYTPGLPFMEHLLPVDQYRIERYPIPDLVHSPVEAAFKEQYGMPILYASVIIRLAEKSESLH